MSISTVVLHKGTHQICFWRVLSLTLFGLSQLYTNQEEFAQALSPGYLVFFSGILLYFRGFAQEIAVFQGFCSRVLSPTCIDPSSWIQVEWNHAKGSLQKLYLPDIWALCQACHCISVVLLRSNKSNKSWSVPSVQHQSRRLCTSCLSDMSVRYISILSVIFLYFMGFIQ